MTNITIDKFQFKRGNEANVPSLDSGEPFISEDSHILFVGTPAGNIEFAKKSDVDANTASLAHIVYDVKVQGSAKGDGVTNDSTAIQSAINAVWLAGGGTVKLPKGTYIATGLLIRTHVRLLGDGVATKLKNPANATTNVISVYDDNTYGFSIENLQIDGNSGNGCTGDGIHLNRTNGATGEPTSEVYEAGDGWFYLEKLNIYNCGQDGLYVGHNCREGRYFNISTSQNKRHGLFNEFGSDNHFFAISSYANTQYGIYDKGSANHFTNCKAWGNGSGSRYSGWMISSWATIYTNCEAQENYGHGFEFNLASNVSFSGCTVSSNGIGGGAGATNPNDQTLASDATKYGFYIYNSNNVQLLGIVGDDFRKKTYGAQTQKAVVYIDVNSDLNVAFINEMFQSTASVNNSTTSSIYSTFYKTFDKLTVTNLSSPNRITSINGKMGAVTQYNGVETVLNPTGTFFSYNNSNDFPVQVVVQGGTVSNISIAKQASSAGTNTGMTQGCFYLAPTDNLFITFSVAPTVKSFPL